jgi:homoserine kinase
VQVPATTANLGAGFDAFGLALDRYLTVRTVPRDVQTERVHTTVAAAGGPAGAGSAGAVRDLPAEDVPDLPADDLSSLASDDTNLVWRSFVTFCDRYDQPVPDVAIRAVTQIPLERGLGSSSSAIVAGLALARAVTQARVGDRELVAVATDLEGHPDNVAPAVLGGLVACTFDDAGGLIVRRVNPAPYLRPIVFVPRVRQSTAEARAVVPDALGRQDVALQAGRAGHVLAALAGVWPVAVGAAGDRLHEPPRLRAMAASGAVVTSLRERGIHAWLSGAGPAVAAVVPAGPHTGAEGRAEDTGADHADDRDDDPLGPAAAVAEAHGFRLERARFDLSGAFPCPDDGCGLAGTGGCVQCPRRRV